MNRSLLLGLLLAGCTTPLHVDPHSGDDLPGGSDDPTTTAPAAPAASGERSTITFALATPVQRRSGDTPERCLDAGEGGALGQASPSEVSVRIRRLTLIGGEGTDDHALVETTDYGDTESQSVSAAGEPLDVEAIPAGTYVGLELSLWTVEAVLPAQLPGVEGSSHTMSMWYASGSGVTARDITVQVDDEDHWIDLETADVVPVADWDAPEDVEGEEAFDTGPAERLRLRDDGTTWATDPAILSSIDGQMVFSTDTGDGTLVVAEGAEASLDIVFQPVDTMSWWEGPVGTGTADADGIFDPTEDCGLDVRVPGVSAIAWTEGVDTGG